MTNKQITEAANKYLAIQLKADPNYLDHVTDSWVYDAEEWFISSFCPMGGIPSYAIQKAKYKFREKVYHIGHTLYMKRFGHRDLHYRFNGIIRDISKGMDEVIELAQEVNTDMTAVISTYHLLIDQIKLAREKNQNHIK